MKKAAMFLADGFEEIEGLTVTDNLRRGGVEITMFSITDDLTIVGAHDIRVIADQSYQTLDPDAYDALVLPGGGMGTQNLKAHEGVLTAVRAFAAAGKIVAAICAAPTVLAKAGVLGGKTVTCYPGCEEEFDETITYTGNALEKDGLILTANGMGAAVPFSLALLEMLEGAENAEKVGKSIMYLS